MVHDVGNDAEHQGMWSRKSRWCAWRQQHLENFSTKNLEPTTTVMRTCGVSQKHSELTVFDSAFKQLERSLPPFTLFVTYVQESSKEVFYVYAYSMPTSSSFLWVPKHDNNAQVRMFIKEAPDTRKLVQGRMDRSRKLQKLPCHYNMSVPSTQRSVHCYVMRSMLKFLLLLMLISIWEMQQRDIWCV